MSDVSLADDPAPPGAGAALAPLRDGVLRVLSELRAALERFDDAAYRGVDGAGGVGTHVRHVIEFHQQFLRTQAGPDLGPLCYDDRARDARCEGSRAVALEALGVIADALGTLPVDDRETMLLVTVDPRGPLVPVRTSLGRELFHLMDHALHHMAMIKMLARARGIDLGEAFGVARSTLASQRR